MEPPVVASVIASTTSLVVAVVGLVANGRGQRKAAREAHANALGLFEQQANRQADARREEARDRLHLAHLDQRRSLYAGLLAKLFQWAVLLDELKGLEAEIDAQEADNPAGAERRSQILERSSALRDQRFDLFAGLWTTLEEVRLVAGPTLAKCADALFTESMNADGHLGEDLRNEYISLARRDLGLDPAQD